MPKYKNYIVITTVIRVIADVVGLYVSFLLAFWVRFYSGYFTIPLGVPPLENYSEAFFISALIFVLVFKSFGLYNQRCIFKYGDELTMILKAVTMGLVLVMALTFIHRGHSYSRLLVALAWLLTVLGLSVSRYLVRIFEPWLCRVRQEYKKVIILGTGSTARYLLRQIKENARWGYQVLGLISNREEDSVQSIDGVPVLGDLYRLQEILEKKRPDEVILAMSGLSHEQMVNLILKCEKRLVAFKLVPDMFELLTSNVDIYNMDGISLLGIKELPLEYAWNRFVKRTLDITGALAGLVLGSPLFLVMPVLIKFSSAGAVFYRQARCGEDGKIFALYKFRTMYADAESKTGPVWAQENDSRCTPIGRWLRNLYLDELPQLINVLRGDMSLVGPRPERPHFVEQFKENVPRYMSRHLIKSGITGWAQVNGLRGNTPLKERVRYDMYYAEHWSVLFDVKILLLTLFSKKKVQVVEEDVR